MSTIEICAGLLFFIALCGLLYRPMLHKPFSEDDGQWLYNALLRRKLDGMELHPSHGYFGVSWIFTLALSRVKDPGPRAVYGVKAVWYTLTGLSVIWFAYALWGNAGAAFVAGLIFLVATVLPSTLFFFTYAEHFFLLPVNISLTLSLVGAQTESLGLIFLAGLFSGWSNQIKITTLLFSLFTPLAFLFFPSSGTAALTFASGYLLVTAIPLVLIKDGRDKRNYVNALYDPVLVFALNTFRKIKLPTVRKAVTTATQGTRYDDKHTHYSEVMQTAAQNTNLRQLQNHMASPARDLFLPLLLAAAQVPMVFFGTPINAVPVTLFALSVVMQQCQQNYHRPHFNPIWVPVSILAAKSICDLAPVVAHSLPAASLSAVTTLLWAGIAGRAMLRSWRAENSHVIGDIEPRLSFLFNHAEIVGREIQKRSEPGDTLFVWGDQPSIYLYAQRKCFNPLFLFVYTHRGHPIALPYLLKKLSYTPPNYLQFYNWRIRDGWDMEALQSKTGVPYNEVMTFSVNNPDGSVYTDQLGFSYSFPLYKRNDTRLAPLLFGKATMLCRLDLLFNACELLSLNEGVFSDRTEYDLFVDFWARPLTTKRDEYLKKLDYLKDTDQVNAILYICGTMALKSQNYQEALQYFEKILAVTPMDARAMALAGESHMHMGKIGMAARRLSKAYALEPLCPTVLFGYAALMYATNEIDKADSLLEQCRGFLFLDGHEAGEEMFEKLRRDTWKAAQKFHTQ